MSIKISELDVCDEVNNQCCLPIVNQGVTKKIEYGTLKSLLESDFQTDNFVKNNANNLVNYELKTNTGTNITLSVNPTTYVMTLQLRNTAGEVISTGTIDLPLETMVVDASYTEGVLTLTLQNGTSVDVNISDIVSGLVPDSRTIAGIDLVDNITANELINGIKSVLDTMYAGISHTHSQSDITGLSDALAGKQDTLTAGSNITIVNNVISATGGSSNITISSTDIGEGATLATGSLYFVYDE